MNILNIRTRTQRHTHTRSQERAGAQAHDRTMCSHKSTNACACMYKPEGPLVRTGMDLRAERQH
eukprot:1431867-Pleurochrysis_carterae.AAC.2